MPKFAPNTGFRMPGLGSKEKNSASNFRDEQHVDKMGYCDNTPDAMLPSGSSPLNYKPIVDDDPYTSAKYSGELAVNIPDPRKEPKVQTEGKGDTTTNNYYGGGGEGDGESNLTGGKKLKEVHNESNTPDTIVKSKYKGPKMSDKAWAALTPAKRRKMNAAVGADKKGDINTTVKGKTIKNSKYYIDGVEVSLEQYNKN